jgi:hypothetical protein
MASIFQNKFFSVAGQKERVTNVVKTIASAVTLKGVQSNTGNAVVDKVLSAGASNPYVTAGIATVIVKAPAIISAVKSSGTASAVTSKVASTGASIGASSAIKAGAVGVVAGYVAGSLGKDSATSKADQNIAPQFTPTQDTTVTPNQYTDNTQITYTTTKNVNSGSGSINSVSSQDPSLTSTPTQETNTIPTFTPTQDINADQTSSASGSTNWGTILAVGIGLYLLSKN